MIERRFFRFDPVADDNTSSFGCTFGKHVVTQQPRVLIILPFRVISWFRCFTLEQRPHLLIDMLICLYVLGHDHPRCQQLICLPQLMSPLPHSTQAAIPKGTTILPNSTPTPTNWTHPPTTNATTVCHFRICTTILSNSTPTPTDGTQSPTTDATTVCQFCVCTTSVLSHFQHATLQHSHARFQPPPHYNTAIPNFQASPPQCGSFFAYWPTSHPTSTTPAQPLPTTPASQQFPPTTVPTPPQSHASTAVHALARHGQTWASKHAALATPPVHRTTSLPAAQATPFQQAQITDLQDNIHNLPGTNTIRPFTTTAPNTIAAKTVDAWIFFLKFPSNTKQHQATLHDVLSTLHQLVKKSQEQSKALLQIKQHHLVCRWRWRQRRAMKSSTSCCCLRLLS